MVQQVARDVQLPIGEAHVRADVRPRTLDNHFVDDFVQHLQEPANVDPVRVQSVEVVESAPQKLFEGTSHEDVQRLKQARRLRGHKQGQDVLLMERSSRRQRGEGN